MMDYTKALCHSIPSFPSDPNKDKKHAHKSVPHWPIHFVYDQQEFPTLPWSNQRPPAPTQIFLSPASFHQAANKLATSTQISTHATQTGSLHIETRDQGQSHQGFNAILHKELAALHSKIQSSSHASTPSATIHSKTSYLISMQNSIRCTRQKLWLFMLMFWMLKTHSLPTYRNRSLANTSRSNICYKYVNTTLKQTASLPNETEMVPRPHQVRFFEHIQRLRQIFRCYVHFQYKSKSS